MSTHSLLVTTHIILALIFFQLITLFPELLLLSHTTSIAKVASTELVFFSFQLYLTGPEHPGSYGTLNL